jgi:hypothetical protein
MASLMGLRSGADADRCPKSGSRSTGGSGGGNTAPLSIANRSFCPWRPPIRPSLAIVGANSPPLFLNCYPALCYIPLDSIPGQCEPEKFKEAIFDSPFIMESTPGNSGRFFYEDHTG